MSAEIIQFRPRRAKSDDALEALIRLIEGQMPEVIEVDWREPEIVCPCDSEPT